VTPAHLHLLLNHVPTIGFGLGLSLYVAATVVKSEDLKRAGLVIFFVIALLALLAYVTGDAANFVLQNEPAVSQDVVAAHKDAAMLALIPMEITGLLAWFALWRSRRWQPLAILVLATLTFALMARAATVGGEVRHPEILAAGASAAVPAWPRAAAAGAAFVLDNPWVWPISEIFHFVGLCLLFGVALLVNLRMLGVVRGVPLADVVELLPWGMLGLTINVVTGMLFFLASPDQYTQNATFAWKMGAILVGGLTLLYPTMVSEDGAQQPERQRLVSRVVATASICLWVGVIFLGRFLPYIGSE
jgi:uncharacterized membrane protein